MLIPAVAQLRERSAMFRYGKTRASCELRGECGLTPLGFTHFPVCGRPGCLSGLLDSLGAGVPGAGVESLGGSTTSTNTGFA